MNTKIQTLRKKFSQLLTHSSTQVSHAKMLQGRLDGSYKIWKYWWCDNRKYAVYGC